MTHVFSETGVSSSYGRHLPREDPTYSLNLNRKPPVLLTKNSTLSGVRPP